MSGTEGSGSDVGSTLTRFSDLVQDSKLNTKIYPERGITQHFYHTASGRNAGQRRRLVEESWARTRPLGTGAFGHVWLESCASGPRQGQVRAVKVVPKAKTVAQRIDYGRELEAVAKFSHDRYAHCFVKSFGWFEDDEAFYIAMEYLEHGDLQKYLNHPFPEVEAKDIASQLIEGLVFMHENNYTHRDIKPANVLVLHDAPQWWVKLSDFGISKRAAEDSTALRTVVGTRGYLAPEIIGIVPIEDFNLEDAVRSSYTSAVDVWAVGELVYRLIANSPAFPEPRDLYSFVVAAGPFPNAPLTQNGASQLCLEFLESMMARSAKSRLTAEKAADHAWVASLQVHPEEPFEEHVSNEATQLHVGQPAGVPHLQPTASHFAATNQWTTMTPGAPNMVAAAMGGPQSHLGVPGNAQDHVAMAQWTTFAGATNDQQSPPHIVLSTPSEPLAQVPSPVVISNQSPAPPYRTPPAQQPLFTPQSSNPVFAQQVQPAPHTPSPKITSSLPQYIPTAASATTPSLPPKVASPLQPPPPQVMPYPSPPPPSGSADSQDLQNLIIGVSIGNEWASVAFAYATSRDAKEDIITEWPGRPYQVRQRIPTSMYYDRFNNVVGWGPDTKNALTSTGDIAEGVIKLDRLFFYLNLASMDFPEGNAQMPPLPTGLSAVDICEDYLSRMRLSIYHALQRTLGDVFQRNVGNIMWHFSVPTWLQKPGQMLLRKALVLAGYLRTLEDRRVNFIYEPEATALFCFHTGLFRPAIGDVLLMIDCRKATIDVFAYETITADPLVFRQCVPAKRDDCGEATVYLAFREFLLENKIKYLHLPQNSRTAGKILNRTLDDFKLNIMQDFRNSGREWAVDVGVGTDFERASIRDGYLTLTNAEVMACFEPTIKRMNKLVDGQLKVVLEKFGRFSGVSNVKALMVTGEFGVNEFVFQQIKLNLPSSLQTRVSRPMDSHAAAVKGAVSAGIRMRYAKTNDRTTAGRSFFVVQPQPFRQGIDPQSSLVYGADGNPYCNWRTTLLVSQQQRENPNGNTRIPMRKVIYDTESLLLTDTILGHWTGDDRYTGYSDDHRLKAAGRLVINLFDRYRYADYGFRKFYRPSGEVYYLVEYEIVCTWKDLILKVEAHVGGEVKGSFNISLE